MVSLNIQRTTLADLEFVLKAENHPENQGFVQVWSKEQHQQALSSSNAAHFLLMHNQQPVGYFIMQDLDQFSFQLRRLVITEKGKGYGRQALRWILEWTFTQHPAQRLWLDVMPHNQRAKLLYKSEGFLEEETPSTCSSIQQNLCSCDGQVVHAIVMSLSRAQYDSKKT